jgi:HSP20 family protein
MSRMSYLVPRTAMAFPVGKVLERFFDDTVLPSFLSEERSFVPVFDITENKDTYTVVAELPGMDESDLTVTFSDGILTVEGEKKQESENKGETYHRIERRYGSFRRSFRIPDDIQEDNIEATYKNGVLTLTVPKSEEKEARKIEIKH